MCDTNPHLVNFYESINNGSITSDIVKAYLIKEGDLLLENGESHYYFIRERFNEHFEPLDFLFLNRAGFNGMIRFNRKGKFNIPFCKKPNRFAQSYVTRITNQVSQVERILEEKDFTFKCQAFEATIKEAGANDIVYCDPPYIARHVDYFNGWGDSDEIGLNKSLSELDSKFILSTWHHNDFRKNEYIEKLWNSFDILTQEHFYHVGGKEKNRNPMVEALITNFPVTIRDMKIINDVEQIELI